MSYLQQILGNAQQRGGLTNEEFNSIFQSFMPQQQAQPNLGMGQITPPSLRNIAKDTNVAGQGMMSMDTQKMSEAMNKQKTNPNVFDRYDASQDYETDMFSEQTRMLAEQDMDDDSLKDKIKDGLLNFFTQGA